MTLAAQVGRLHRETETNQRAIQFCDVAKYLALAKGSPRSVERLAEHHRIPPHLKEVLKAAVDPGSTTGWGQQLANYNLLADAFLASLRNVGVFDALLSFTKQVPLHTQIAIATLGATAASVGQGHAKPVSKVSLANSAIQERKAVAIVVVADELLRASAIANKLFATELSLAVASETDSQFLAAITSGVSPINSNGGSTAIACAQDLAAALGALSLDSQSKVFIVVEPATARHLATQITSTGEQAFPTIGINGGVYAGATVLVSDNAINKIIAIDANQIAANGEMIELDSSNQVAIQLDSQPDSPPSASTPATSFWQNNLTGLRATRFWGGERLRSGAVSVISGVSYTGNSPA